MTPLRVVARNINMIRTQRNVRGHAQRDGGIDTREFFHGDHIVDVVVAGPAKVLRENCSEHTHRAKFAKNLDRKVLRLVPLHDVRLDLAFREFANGPA